MKEIATMLWTAGRQAYKRDRDNRYDLKVPWPLPLINLELPAYDGPYITIVAVGKQARITVKPYSGDVCDGASFVPDSIKGLLPAALFHDPWYLEIPAIAKAWGWSELDVQRLGDAILSTIQLRAGGNHLAARVFYNTLYYGGCLFRWGGKYLPGVWIAAACLGMASCSSCLSPPDLSDPDSPYVPPTYVQTAGGNVGTTNAAPETYNGPR